VITSNGSGTYSVLGSHTYSTAGSYAISVGITGPEGSQATANGTATVTAPNTGGPQDLASQPISAQATFAFNNLTIGSFTDADPGVGPQDFNASVDWGDGITTPSTTIQPNGSQAFIILGTHTYENSGTYTYTIELTDNKGNKLSKSNTATVS